MDIVTSLKWRYATKKFDVKKMLSAEKLAVLTEAFNLTATSYGLQPLKMVVVQDKQLQSKMVDASFNQRQVLDASHVLVICIEREVKGDYVHGYFDSVRAIRNTPETILKPFRETLAEEFEEKSIPETRDWAVKQAYLALGNLLTVCALEAIDSCPMEGFVPEKYDELLNLEAHDITSVLVLPVGYRAQDDMFSGFEKIRRPMEETIIHLR